MEFIQLPRERGPIGSAWADKKPGMHAAPIFDVEPCPICNAKNQTCTHFPEGQNHG